MSSGILSERIAQNSKLKNLHDRARKIVPIDSGHDFSHIERVSKLTVSIFSEEIERREHRSITPTEVDSCLVSALLHDGVPIAKNSPLRKESSRLASEKAKEWLTELAWPAEWVEVIVAAILDHSFSSGRVPNSLLGCALQDADRLEALGALGLYRTIATGVSMGAQLFDFDDPWAERRELDDQRFTIDHFFTKLLKLPETFRTQSAKLEAQKRADFLKVFLEQLRREI